MKGAKATFAHLQILFKRSHLHCFYQLKFRIYDEGFRSQQEKKLLSGDDSAVFEVLLHGGLWKRGSKFKVQSSEGNYWGSY